MSSALTSLKGPLSEGVISPSLTILRERLRQGLAWRRAYSATFNELARLSDRDLADLGIARSDIVRIAKEAATETAKAS